jgi:hypothetical protein
MNGLTLQQLKILVERAVRPVRASTSRKRKMREELLAHVSAVFEEEAKRGDESAALAQTTQRFGDPAALTRQLQSAVPAGDRFPYWIEAFAGNPARESALRRGLRYAALTGAFSAIFLVCFTILSGYSDEWLTLARLPSLLAPVWMGFLIICATILEEGMRQALFGPRGRDWLSVVAVGAAAWLLVPALLVGWCFALTGDVAASLFEVLPLFATGLLAPLALVIIVNACVKEIRYLDEWSSLKID